jgi:hypothetical protein
MSIKKDDDAVIQSIRSDVTTAPAAGDLFIIDSEHETQLTSLDVDTTEDNVFEVVVRDQGGGNARVVATYEAQSFEDGSFDDPVAEAGAGREIAVTIQTDGSADVPYRSNYRVDKRKV